jgi:hypothetical protein
LVQPNWIFCLATETVSGETAQSGGHVFGRKAQIQVLGGAPETTYGTRPRFKTINVSRKMASCFGGNFGCLGELTGSLTDFGTEGFDVKVNQGVADVVGHPESPTLCS